MDEQTEFKKLVEKGLMVVSSELEDKIKEEQRIREALKNNSKKRVSTVGKMESEILKFAKKSSNSVEMDRWVKLLNCGKYRDQFIFSDSHMIFWLNDNIGYQVVDNYVVDGQKYVPTSEDLENGYTIEEKDLKYLIKLKENYVVTDTLFFNYKYVERALKILDSCTIKFLQNKSCLYFTNSNDEHCLLIGAKYTK